MLPKVISGTSWVIALIVASLIIRPSYEAVSGYIGTFVTVATIASIGIISLYHFINKRKHIFSKYHLYTLIANIFSLYMFAKMAESVVDMDLVTNLDIWLNERVTHLWSPQLNEVMIFITNIASPLNLSLFSIFLLVVLFIKKKWYYSILLVTGMTGGVLFKLLIKFLMQRERPLNALIEASGYSFPSGHATMAIIFFVTLLFAFKDEIKNSFLKLIFTGTTVLAFLLVGLSRVYLNVHWFSDVLAGFALGMFWLTLLVLVFQYIGLKTRKLFP